MSSIRQVTLNGAVSATSPQSACVFVSFDGGAKASSVLEQPDRYRYWDNKFFQAPVIARGAGLSYAAASFIERGLVVSHAKFNRIIGFDRSTHTVEVESGICLYDLYKFLYHHRLYLPIQPGHGRITVGGCVAADVHGKNQARDGTFINQVESLTLFHPRHGMIELSRSQNPELFRLTCGGYGLTGHIIKVKLRVTDIPAGLVKIKAVRFSNIVDGIEALVREPLMADFTYSWHDMASVGKNFGSGFVFFANFVEDDQKQIEEYYDDKPPELSAEARAMCPIPLLNSFSLRLLNFTYQTQQKKAISGKFLSLQGALFPAHKAQFYFKLFGRKGFHEYQIILPKEKMYEYLQTVKKLVDREGLVVTLASAKAFAGTQELLRFSGEGVCFALNFPRGHVANKVLPVLDKTLIELGGVPNLIKDSRLPRAVMEACYSEAEKFRMALNNFDSKRMFRSELSERLGL